MSRIGVAIPPACLADAPSLASAMAHLLRARVSLIQIHLVSLLSTPMMSTFLHTVEQAGIRLVVHLDDADDVFALPHALKDCAVWRDCVLHPPKPDAIATTSLNWCAERLARRQVRLLIENTDNSDEAADFTRRVRTVSGGSICFDVGHEDLAPTGIIEDTFLLDRIELVHLHAADPATRISHLNPWTDGVVREDILACVLRTKPDLPLILEVRNLRMETLSHTVEHVSNRLAGLGWHPEPI